MDINEIVKLLPEFLENFKGKNLGNMQDIISSLGNTNMLEKVLGENNKYSKFLPLLPLLAKLNQNGFKGLLNNSENLLPLIQSLAGSGQKGPGGLDLSNIASLLPVLASFLNKDKKAENDKAQYTSSSVDSETTKNNIFNNESTSNKENLKTSNPLAPISEIADKDIIFALNKYISNSE